MASTQTLELIEDRWTQATMDSEKNADGDWVPKTSALYDQAHEALSKFAAILVSYEVSNADANGIACDMMQLVGDRMVDWAVKWYAGQPDA
jgi:hypothetical protein